MPSALPQPVTATATLAAATPTTIDLNLNASTNWTIVLRNTGANPVTALTIAVSPLGDLFEAAASITTGLPLAAATSLSIRAMRLIRCLPSDPRPNSRKTVAPEGG